MVKVLSAVFLPPVGVYLQSGPGKRFYLNIALTLLGVIPGVVHAIWGLTEEKKRLSLGHFAQEIIKLAHEHQ